MISIKLHSNFIEIAHQYGCSPVNLLHVFRTPFSKNTYRGLLLHILEAEKMVLLPLLPFKIMYDIMDQLLYGEAVNKSFGEYS